MDALFFVIGTTLAIGCLVGSGFIAVDCFRSGEIGLGLLTGGFGLVLTALCAGLVVPLYNGAFSEHPTFTLRTEEWGCTDSHSQTHLQPMLVGKATVLMPMTRTVCDQYSRKA